MVFTSLGVALLFAAIYLFGGRLAFQPGQRGRRRFLSFAAGIAVAYTFVDVLPALGRMQNLTTHNPSDFHRVFPEYSVYLWTMAGFLAFFWLETMAAKQRNGRGGIADNHGGEAPWRPWVHIGGFTLYAWMLTYIMVWKWHDPLAVCMYGVAMGLHIFPIACDLSSHYKTVYDRRGAFLMAAASLAGWASGVALDIPAPILVNLVAIVAGGVIVNSAIAELPKEKESRFGSLLAGAVFYSALLLILSHFE